MSKENKMQAVILAAGLGSRLKDKTKEMPKGFIEIDGLAIVERSIKKLIEHGIAEIIIGTGHCSNYYDALAKKYPNITTVFNADFANTSSMATLNLCASFIKGNFLLLESDLIYDDIGLFVLINDKRNDVVLLSSKTNSGDEVYVEADEKFKLLNVSKDINKVKPYGELVGISKLTPEALEAMRRYFSQGKNPHMDYETAMAQVSSLGGHDIFVEKIENYCWCEIDDENHLERAKKEIAPKILNGERLRKVKREILLNPGPATTTDSVKYAQVCADICPREKEFGDVLAQTALELSKMGGDSDQTETVLLGGSGTAADEAMISS
ncbi:MAG: NTP transferase domain-containing protein, partial [Elusimicrobiota bacterium]|nr:NTP transferase domain-containing protein [Elusimicrobiota bacterium]